MPLNKSLLFAASKKYALSERLHATFGASTTPFWKNKGARHLLPAVDIVSPALCDDVLSYIGSSLQKHRGCTILDINPGVGLWSSKMHELLQPRKHVLFEASTLKNIYRPFLEPLLQKAGSRYLLETYEQDLTGHLNDAAVSTWMDRHLSSKPRFNWENGSGIPGSNDILILANLSKRLHEDSRDKVETLPSRNFLKDFVRQLRWYKGLHSTGAVRLLLWADDATKLYVRPREIVLRNRGVFELEELLDMTEIVSADLVSPRFRRAATIELHSAINVAKRMESAGLVIPNHRQSLLSRAAQEAVQHEVHDTSSLDGPTRENPLGKPGSWRIWLSELEKLEAEEQQYWIEKQPKSRRKGPASASQARLQQLRDGINSLIAIDLPSPPLAMTSKILGLEIERLSIEHKLAEHLQSSPADEVTTTGLQARYRELSRVIHTIFNTRENLRPFARGLSMADNHSAFHRPTPLLMHDHRSLDPLVPQADEFWPQTPLVLFDVCPKPLLYPDMHALTPAHAAAQRTTIMHRGFLQVLLSAYDAKLRHAIERVSIDAGPAVLGTPVDAFASSLPGSSNNSTSIHAAGTVREQISFQTPESRAAHNLLLDPLRGGRLDLDDLRVRMVTPEMLRALFTAWMAGPFTRAENEMIERLHSQVR